MRPAKPLALLAGAAALAAAAALRHAVGRPLCFCVYYGNVGAGVERWLRGCRVAVLAPTLPRGVLAGLRAAGVEAFGYVSATTLGGWEPWAGLAPRSVILGNASTGWGERVVDACSPAWARVLRRAVEMLAGKGYRGVFLDNLDMADRYPWMRPCVARLVRSVKKWAPGMMVMVNRGFSLLPEIAGSIDYLLFEDFATYYDPRTGSYRVFPATDLEWEKRVLDEAATLAERNGFRVLLLAYAPPGGHALLERICREWRSWGRGLPLYVAPGLLQAPGVCNPCGSG